MQIIAIIILIIFLIFAAMAFTGAPYVPSRREDLNTAFTQLYPLGKKDTLIDLGAGAGAVMLAAEKHGAKTIGIELNPLLALIARLRTKGQVVCKSYYYYNFPKDTTVVYVFGDSRDIAKIYQKVQTEATRLKKPLYLISLGFQIPEQTPEKQVGASFLYKIPA